MPAIPLLGIFPENMKTVIWKDICTPMFIAALFIIAKIWRQPMFIGRWTYKSVVYIYTMEYYSALKKNEFLPFATIGMDFKAIMLSEVSQTEKDKYHMISLICAV